MKRVLAIAALLSAFASANAQPDPKFKLGAKPSPPAKIVAAAPHLVAFNPPPQFAVIPKRLSVWLNNVTGDCVTAQEAFSKASWSVFCRLDELFVPDQEVERWAKKHGYWNGAMLTDVMDTMQKDGFQVEGKEYNDGPYRRVNYRDDIELQSAICSGPVNIAIDASALPRTAGNQPGWYKFGGGRYPDTNHCVALTGYGTAKFCFDSLGVPLPANVNPDKKNCYLLFTWGTIGVVDHDWLQGTCTEAWVRVPTTPGQEPPAPVPPVPPVPATSGPHWLLILLVFGGIVVGVFLLGRASNSIRRSN